MVAACPIALYTPPALKMDDTAAAWGERSSVVALIAAPWFRNASTPVNSD
jgi:hypothetical protein